MTSGRPPEREPGEAVAEDGLVLLDGPDAVAVTMTAEAARATAAQLSSAADAAERDALDRPGVEEHDSPA